MVRPFIAATVFSTKADFVQRVGVDHHLHVHRVGDRQAAVDGGGGGAPILVQFQRAGAAKHLFLQRGGQGRIALASEGEVHRKSVRRLQHASDMPGAGRAGGGQRAMRRAGAAAQHGREAGMQRVLDLLGADEVDVAVEPTGGQDAALARDGLGAGPMTISTPGWVSGLPALPILAMRPSFRPTSAL